MLHFRFESIATKLLIPLVLSYALIVLLITIPVIWGAKHRIDARIEERAREVYEIVSVTAEMNTMTSSLQRVVNIVGAYKDVKLVMLLDPISHKVVASNKKRYLRRSVDKLQHSSVKQLAIWALDGGKSDLLSDESNERSFHYQFFASIDGRHLRDIKMLLVIDPKPQVNVIRLFVFRLLLVVSVGLLLAIVLIYYFIHKVLIRPLYKLKSAIHEGKNATPLVKDHSQVSDEIQELFFEYNQLMSELQYKHKDLLAARDESERATRAKSEFLATMSHEIRTPLNGFIGTTELLFSTDLSAEQSEYVKIQKQAAQQMMSIISDILDISKIEAGKIEMDVKPFCLVMAIKSSVDLYDLEARKNNLNLSFFIPSKEIPLVLGDEVKFKQVVINLISNAVKFTQEGSVSVTLLTELLPDQMLRTQLQVRDTGVGIEHHKLGDLFNRYSQVGSFNQSGTGLGLSICRMLCEKMGGSIEVDSEFNKGSAFTIDISFKIAHQQQMPINELSSVLYQLRCLLPIRILLVEDNKVNSMITTASLTKFDCEVDVASNGEEAIDLYQQHRYDLILMDCFMPVIDGFDATLKIRSIKSPKYVPIIALTACAQQQTVQRCQDVGMDDFLVKPYKSLDFYQTILTWLSR